MERFLAAHGRYDTRPRARVSQVARIELELSTLRESVAALQPAVDGTVARERDGLRAKVVDLEEALTRAHMAVELQRDADAERARVIEHLLMAMTASERADALRRQAATVLEEALAGFTRPGHPGEMS